MIYEWLHTFLWDGIMLPAILLFGGFLLLKSRFYPLTKMKQWMKLTVGSLFVKKNGKEKGNGLSGFQAACTALAAALGTGNIAGVATALTAGGPGAIFWMWISGLFGMMLQYAEIALGTLYQKREPDGTLSGGPMYYMEYGLGKKKMAKLYAALCILASLGVGNMVQANSMAQGLWDTFSIPPLLSGTVCCILTAAALFGGVKRIGKMAEKLIPVISCLYIGAAFLFLLFRLPALPQAFASIFEGAFQFRAGVAGAAGYGIKRAVTIGLARGTFSHEAGMGSGAIAHGASEAESPEKQGMWGIFQVFFDTIVMCTMTALVIMVSGVYNVNIYGEVLSLTGGLAGLPDGAALTGIAFASIFGSFGKQLVAVALSLFAFSTLMAWAYYGELCFRYLFGDKITGWYRFFYLLAIPAGAVAGLSVIWGLSDICNGLMALPNMLALFLLRKDISRFLNRIKGGGR